MTFNYKTGLFRIWLVLSLFWVVVTALAEFAWGAVLGLPLVFGVVLFLVVWTIRGFGAKDHPPAQSIDLMELRQKLASTQTEDSDTYKAELEPLLDRLEAKYGSRIPLREIEGLQQFLKGQLIEIEKKRQQGIDREAKKGGTIEMDALRGRLEASKAAYSGPGRDAYVREMDRLLESLTARYGSRIPVDDAYKIMRELEGGPG